MAEGASDSDDEGGDVDITWSGADNSQDGMDIPVPTEPSSFPDTQVMLSPPKATPLSEQPVTPRPVSTPARAPKRLPGDGEAKQPSPVQQLSSSKLATPMSGRKKKTPLKSKQAVPDDELDIPDMNDPTALKPVVGEPQLSHKAIEMRSQRMFKRRANGSLKVSEVVFKEWHEKGARRTLLETIFRQVGYDPASFVQ